MRSGRFRRGSLAFVIGVGASVALAGPHDVVVATAIDVRDATFESNVTTALSGAGFLHDIERLPDGKFLLATGTGLKRLNADGTLDQTFVPDTDIRTQWVTNVALLSDGGFAATNGFLFPNPTKFDSSGARDSNSNGWNTYPGTPRSLLALPDGGFLVAGEACVQKIDANGLEVTSFLTNHASQLMGNFACPEVFDIVADGTGFVLATNLVGALSYPVIRLNADGTLDSTFNSNVGAWLSDQFRMWTARDVVKLPDGDFLVVGDFSGAGSREVDLVRINADGTRDVAFNSTVEQEAARSLWNNNSSPLWEGGSLSSVAVDPTGEILVGGLLYVLDDPSIRNPNDPNWGTSTTRVVRLSAGGSYISAFEAGVQWPNNWSNYAIEIVPIPSEGRTLVLGDAPAGHIRVYSGNAQPTPTVTAVSPTSGSTAGGTPVTITGTNFAAGATVTVGGSACTGVNVVSATSITCTTPAGTAGTASVLVTSNGLSNTANTLFTYTAPPPPPPAAPPAAPVTTAPPTTLPNVPVLIDDDNQPSLTRAPGSATAIVNGEVVEVEVEAPADLPAAQKDPEDRSPAEVAALQNAAESLVDELNDVAGGNSGLSVVPSPTGASITGLMSVPVPIENTVIVKTNDQSTMFAALNQDGSVTEVEPGAQIEVLGNGQVGVAAFGLTPGETVEFVLMSTPTLLGRFEVDAQGGIKAQAQLPSSVGTGNHTLVVASPSVKASLGLKIGTPAAPTLPVTGGDAGDLAPVLLLLAVGAVLVIVSRRRITLVP